MKASDEELIERIKVVFNDYDDGLSEQGWAELRQKFPEKKHKKLPIWWLSGIAASLLLVMGLYFGEVFNGEKTMVATVNHKKFENPSDSIISSPRSGPHSTTENPVSAIENAPVSPKSYQKANKLGGPLTTEVPLIANTIQTGDKEPAKNVVAPIEVIKNPPAVIDHSNVVTTNKVAHTQVAGSVQNEAVQNNTTERETPPTKLSTEAFLNNESQRLANSKNKTVEKNSSSKTTLDVYTGTFFNYHDDNEAKLSAGVGLNANVKVTKNLVLSFGAGISQNKVSYENQVPATVVNSMFTARDNALSLAPSNSVYSATATNDVSFNGQLLTIDLPMAVKFYPTKKQDFYISTGINSTTYLSQKYTYNYNWSNFEVKNGEAQQRQETEKSTFRGFDFANSAIIAIGINQNIGRNTLIFEPYYKPALGTMGDKNLRISSAGLNLKFNFNGAKK